MTCFYELVHQSFHNKGSYYQYCHPGYDQIQILENRIQSGHSPNLLVQLVRFREISVEKPLNWVSQISKTRLTVANMVLKDNANIIWVDIVKMSLCVWHHRRKMGLLIWRTFSFKPILPFVLSII